MQRFLVTCVLVLVCSSFAIAETGSLEERVREAALRTYVHGMTMTIAQQEVGPEGVPVLLDLLRDPEFPRRDNVVAMLAYLGRDVDAPKLMALMDDARITNDRPEDYRSRLLVPEALGRIASRGGDGARAALYDLERELGDAENSGLSTMVDYGVDIADGNVEVFPEPPENYVPVDPDAIDTNPNIHDLSITYANHVDTNSPISDATVDAALANVSAVMATENATNDTACCVNLVRSAPGGTFGSPGNGWDVITSSGEMNIVLSHPVARIKVVDLITWCGGTGSNIIGCGATPGNGIALVRISGTPNEGKLWAHELGHNAGLGHNPSFGFIMFGSLSSSNTRLSTFECNRYHLPSAAANLQTTVTGSCNDNDGDGVMSSIDNCPTVANFTQTDSDQDLVGNACDNCDNTPNPDQADCDNDSQGDACDASSSPPPPVSGLIFSAAETLSWSPSFFRKNVYRGEQVAGNPWHNTAVIVGTVTNGSQTFDDDTLPGEGRLLYWFVTTFNGCGESN